MALSEAQSAKGLLYKLKRTLLYKVKVLIQLAPSELSTLYLVEVSVI